MTSQRKKWLPSLQFIFLLVSLVALLLSLGGLHFVKIYENALVRQTESELIAQSAFIAASYKNEIAHLQQEGQSTAHYGVLLPKDIRKKSEYDQSIPDTIDLTRDPVFPTRPNGIKRQAPDPIAAKAGARIIPILKDAQHITLSGMKVLDSNGVAVAGQQELGLSFAHLTEVKSALKGKPDSLIRKRIIFGRRPKLSSTSRGADINVFVSMPIILNDRLVGVVLVNRTPTDVMKALYAKRKDIAFAMIAVLMVTLVIAMITSRTITGPIDALINQARRITEGDRNAAVPLKNPMTREIAILSESFASMAKTIEHRSEYIRQFAMHVSHEFKTPLTAIQGSIELLQEHLDTMPVEQRDRFLANIAQDTDRLKRLVSRLLELARADVRMPVSEPTDMMPILEQFVERYKDFGLQIQIFSNHTPPLMAAIAPEILETVLSNLLDNSVQHQATRMEIEVISHVTMIDLRLADNGQGISPANREKLFTPFFTTYREQGGTGLGLSITRSLLRADNGEITHIPSETGAIFSLRLMRSA